MATYTVASGELGAYAKTATADTVDTITFSSSVYKVEVYGDGTDALYFTTNGTAPTVGGNGTYFLPSGSAASRTVKATPTGGQTTVVKVISHGTTVYSVSAA
jgi:hypothetical protein